jgi:hypothetical protein
MAHRSKIIKEFVDVNVTSANTSFKERLEVDKHAVRILGIALDSNYDDRIYYRGSQKISINEKEIYPEGYESKMLVNGTNVSVNDRMITLGEEIEVGNRKIEIDYKDTDHPSAPFIPYRVRLYVYSLLDNSD